MVTHSGKVYPHAIYAHAPSSIKYTLGGKWKHFSGAICIMNGKSGRARFTIKADGKEIWKSPVINEHSTVEFSLDISGVTELELIATPHRGIKAACWSVWLNPIISKKKDGPPKPKTAPKKLKLPELPAPLFYQLN